MLMTHSCCRVLVKSNYLEGKKKNEENREKGKKTLLFYNVHITQIQTLN